MLRHFRIDTAELVRLVHTVKLRRFLLCLMKTVDQLLTERIDPNGIPAMNFYQSSDNNSTSDRWLTDASYLIFKNLYLSWNVPSKWTKTLGLQGLSIQGSVDNLFTLTSRKGLNPQYSFIGTQDATYVSARAFNLGLNIKF